MAKNNLDLVKFCEQALASGTGYVYGTLGQTCTASLLDDCARRYPAGNLAGGTMRTVGNKWIGRRVTDCIGLLKYFIMSAAYGSNPKYNAAYDTSANGAFNAANEKGPISTLPEIPGVCLHMNGHFGIYIGNGYAIEARGTAYGVVKTRVKDRPWTYWFKSPWIDYIAAAPTPATPKFTCDTAGTVEIARGSCYTAKTTGDVELVAGTPGRVQIIRCLQNGYTLWHIVPIGQPGQDVGIYPKGGARQFVVKIK